MVSVVQNKAGERAVARSRASLHSSSGKSSSILHTVLNLYLVTITCLSTPSNFLAGRSLASDRGIKDDLQDWLKGLAAISFDEGNQNLVRRCDICLDLHSHYVEKKLNAGTSMLQ